MVGAAGSIPVPPTIFPDKICDLRGWRRGARFCPGSRSRYSCLQHDRRAEIDTSHDVVRDIRALAERLGLPVTDVIVDAVHRRLAEEIGKEADAQAAARRRVVDVLARLDALAVNGPILTDADLCGPDGLPW